MIEAISFLKRLVTAMQLRQVTPLHGCLLLIVVVQSTTTTAGEVTTRPAVAQKSPVPSTLLVAELFDEEILAENIFAVRRRALEMPEEERYAYLTDWVLPSDNHSTIRMSGGFTPVEPAPIVAREYRDAKFSGGTIVSPVFDLLDLAAKLGRLKQLRDRVAAMPDPGTESQKRARTSLRILLAMELDEASTLESDVTELQKMVTSMTPRSMTDQWPETLVAFRSVTKFPKSVGCDIVSVLISQRVQGEIPKNCPTGTVR